MLLALRIKSHPQSLTIPQMELWTGLVCLVANPACKGFRRFGDQGKGGYVNVVAWTDSAKNFEQPVTTSCEELDCIVCEIDQVELLEAALEGENCPDEFLRCVLRSKKI